jgi:hypothetical protein
MGCETKPGGGSVPAPTSRPVSSTDSGASRYRASPATRSGSRLVARMRISSQVASNSAHSAAAASIMCSQLSSTSSSCCRDSARSSAAAAGIPGRSRTLSAAATAAATRAGSATGASSASHAPSANRPATCLATSAASRVLPTPPGPVTVTSRYSPSRPTTSPTAATRPMRLVSGAGTPCTPPVAVAAADRFTPVP